MKLAVLGAGAWGTALTISLAPRHTIALWARNAGHARALAMTRINQQYLPGLRIPDPVVITPDFAAAVDDCDLVLVATTTAGLRATLKRVAASKHAAPVVWLCKGFDTESAQLPHAVAAAELGALSSCGVLSGPSFAQEVARGCPTALTLASRDPAVAQRIARELHHDRLRIYSSDDVAGVEVAGALKNVMAIAAGISDGLGL